MRALSIFCSFILVTFWAFMALCILLPSCNQNTGNTNLIKEEKPSITTKISHSKEISGENALIHAERIVAIGDRSPASPGAKQQRQYLTKILQSYGWQVREQAFTTPTPKGDISFVNVRARFGNTNNWSTPLGIVSCHIDTKTGIPGFVGANDGASGAALLLELARILQIRPDIANKVEFVFFDGEESFEPHMTTEDGLYGSKYYAGQLKNPLPPWLINLDMVGRQGMKIRIPPDTADSLYTHYIQGIHALNLSPSVWGVASGAIMDDHIPFMQKGIPSLNIIDQFTDGIWWHTSADSIDILGADSFYQSGRMVLYLLEQLSH